MKKRKSKNTPLLAEQTQDNKHKEVTPTHALTAASRGFGQDKPCSSCSSPSCEQVMLAPWCCQGWQKAGWGLGSVPNISLP